VLTVSPSFDLGRCESTLGNYSNHSHEPLRATPLRLPAAPELREGGAKHGGRGRRPVVASLCEAWPRRPQGDGYRGSGAVALNL
jgi:hypothetical protein